MLVTPRLKGLTRPTEIDLNYVINNINMIQRHFLFQNSVSSYIHHDIKLTIKIGKEKKLAIVADLIKAEKQI